MAKKERLEDIDVMQGIDFEKNQRRMRRIQERVKKQQRMNIILGILIIIAVVLLLTVILNVMEKDAYKSCIENGMNAKWCEVHVK
jgi:hypothetical protein